MTILGIDFETASACDLKSAGAWRYSLHPSTIVRCAVIGWVSRGEVKIERWQRGEDVPGCILEGLAYSETFLAHNCAFEKAIWTNVLHARGDWPVCAPWWEDTQAHAAAANLPVTLEGLGAALGCPVQKDLEGNALMKRMMWLEDDGTCEHDTPENRQRLLQYCETDVRSMLACWDRVPKMIPSEHRLWELDQRINARGVYLDRRLAAQMLRMAEKRRGQLGADLLEDTDFGLISAKSTPAVKTWLKDHGVELPLVDRTRVNGERHKSESISLDVAEELSLADDCDPVVRQVLLNRMEVAKLTSLAKLKRVELLVDQRDGRLRNALQFCAAHTGRWSSRGLQLHNLARPEKGDTPEEKALLARAYAAVLAGDLNELTRICEETA